MLERLIRLSIRWHWLPFIVALLFQYYIGSTVISEKPFVALPKISLPFTGQQLFDAHIILGNILVIFGSVLTMEKMAVLLLPIRRVAIPNPLVRGHIEGHFVGLSLQLMLQWVSMNSPDTVENFFKDYLNIRLPENYWRQLHAVNAMIMVVIALVLCCEKLYLIRLRAPKTEKAKSS